MADNNPLSDAFDFGVQNPDDVQNAEDSMYAKQAAVSPVQQGVVGMQQGFNTLAGGSPRVREAQKLQDAMSAIMQQVNTSGPENEDPIDKQLRMSQAMATGMAGINPQVAMKANENAALLQQAKIQQATLAAKSAEEQQKAKVATLQGKSLNVAGVNDKGELVSFGNVDADDPQAALKINQLKEQAKAAGVTAGLMTDDKLNDGKLNVILQKNAASLQQAQIRAAAGVQEAMIRAQASGNGLSGREATMTYRIMSSAELASQSLQNIVEMPFGTNVGYLGTGVGATPGTSVMQAVAGDLKNGISDKEAQMYNVMVTGLGRNLGSLEMQGLAQGGQHFADQISATLTIRPGDKPATVMTKLAEARQIVDTATRVYLSNPKFPQNVKDGVQESIDKLKSAIPFTVHDVTMFVKAQEKNPKLTMADYAAKNGLGSTGNETSTPAAAASGPKEGDKGTSKSGKPTVFTGGKWHYQ